MEVDFIYLICASRLSHAPALCMLNVCLVLFKHVWACVWALLVTLNHWEFIKVTDFIYHNFRHAVQILWPQISCLLFVCKHISHPYCWLYVWRRFYYEKCVELLVRSIFSIVGNSGKIHLVWVHWHKHRWHHSSMAVQLVQEIQFIVFHFNSVNLCSTVDFEKMCWGPTLPVFLC